MSPECPHQVHAVFVAQLLNAAGPGSARTWCAASHSGLCPQSTVASAYPNNNNNNQRHFCHKIAKCIHFGLRNMLRQESMEIQWRTFWCSA